MKPVWPRCILHPPALLETVTIAQFFSGERIQKPLRPVLPAEKTGHVLVCNNVGCCQRTSPDPWRNAKSCTTSNGGTEVCKEATPLGDTEISARNFFIT
jgi:hypothetical protein